MVYTGWVSEQSHQLIKYHVRRCSHHFWLFVWIRLAEEAALSCLEQRDMHGLHMVHTSAKNNNDRALLAKVENYMARLTDKR